VYILHSHHVLHPTETIFMKVAYFSVTTQSLRTIH